MSKEQKDAAAVIALDAENKRLKAELAAYRKLLEIAKCPCCDGSGGYYDGDGGACQCQWCDEKNQLIPSLPKGAKTCTEE